MKKEIYYLGLLANTNDSILNVKLEHGFTIKSMSEEEGLKLLANLDTDLSGIRFWGRFFHQRCFDNENRKFFYIHNSTQCDIDLDDVRQAIFRSKERSDLDNLAVEYLSNITRLMRLYKQGNVCIPFQYFYYTHNNALRTAGRGWTGLDVHSEPFVIEESELADLQQFLKETKIPFTKPYLKLAFQNFESSYQVRDTNLSFLSLMIALEALFNRGQQEISYTIRRNTAVLLGECEKESKEIYSDIKNLYGKRSKIVHEGKLDIVDKNDVEKLRNYVRKAIKKIYPMNIDKEDLFNVLNSHGFGQIN